MNIQPNLFIEPDLADNYTVIASIHRQMLVPGSHAPSLLSLMDLIDVERDLAPVYTFAGRELGCTRAEINEAIRRKKVRNKLGYYPKDASDFVERFVQRRGYSMPFNGEIKRNILRDDVSGAEISQQELERNPEGFIEVKIRYGGQLPTIELMHQLILENDKYEFGFRDAVIDAAVSQWRSDKRKQALMMVYAKIRYAPNIMLQAAEEWERLVTCAFDLSRTRNELAIAVVKKFMWQVKRKMIHKEVTNHLMLVLFGPQGTGKSTLARQFLCGPVQEVVKQADFVGVCDDKNLELFEFYVVFLDEMDKANRVDSGTIKRRITEPTVSTRLHRTHTQGQQDNHATFIGTSNLPIDQVIVDTTGTRRFFQLDMLEGAKQHWTYFAEVDWLKLWQSVDEAGDDPTAPFLSEIQGIQEADRARSVVEDWAWWVDEHYPQELGRFVLCKDLYFTQEQGGNEERPTAVEWCFSAFQDRYAPGARFSELHFGKEMTKLCKFYGSAFPLTKKEVRTASGWKYAWQQAA